VAIVVKLFANFREALGKGVVEVKNVENVEGLIEKLIQMERKLENEFYYPGTKELVKTIQIMVNGKNIKNLDGLETSLKSGDEVAIFPPVAGG